MLLLGFFLVAGGCYTIKYIIQPERVFPKSAFNVKISVQCNDKWEPGDYVIGHGILGILLPEGWTVIDSAYYHARETNNNYSQQGFFCYHEGVVSFLKSHNNQPPSGYYWWGAKSLDMIDMAYFDSGFVNITIITDEKIGDFKTKYVVGDDSDWNKNGSDLYSLINESDFIPIKADIVQPTANFWKHEEWVVYPNPSNGQIFIQMGSLSGDVTMRIYDLNGRLQKSDILRENLNCIDLNTFARGTYIISLEKHGEIKTKKVIIQ